MTTPESVLHDYLKKYGVELVEDIKLSVSFISALEAIFKEVLSDLQPKQSDYENRRTLVNTIGELVKNNFGSGKDVPVVEAFGSFTMDMFTADSDLDLSVKLSSKKDLTSSRREQIVFLRNFTKVLSQLQNNGGVQLVQPILNARVPIVKFVDTGTWVECDISVENNDGVLKSLIIFLMSSIDDRFRTLTFLLKVWAKAHYINSSKDHTLNSLSVTLLVIIHLQTRDPPILPPLSAILEGGKDTSDLKENVQRFKGFGQKNKETTAELFVCFFSKLLSLRNFWKHGLCASTFDGSWISTGASSSEPAPESWIPSDRINVEDFIHRSENCARAVNKKKFQLIYQCIQATHKQLSRFNKAEIEASELKRLLFGTFGSANASPMKAHPKKIKLGKSKKLRASGLAKAGTKVVRVPQQGPANWDALIDQQKSHAETGDHWERLPEGAAASKRKQLLRGVEPVASTSANTAGLNSAIPPSSTNLAREDPQQNHGDTGIRVDGNPNPSFSSGAVSNGYDLMKNVRHSKVQTGVAQYQQMRSDFPHQRPPFLLHQQQGFGWQNQLPPCLPHQLYNGSQRHPHNASGPHESFGVRLPHSHHLNTGLQQPYPGFLRSQSISLQQPHPQDLASHPSVRRQPHLRDNLVGMQQPHLRQNLMSMQQPHPDTYITSGIANLQEIHRPQHGPPQFGNPTYRLPHNWCPANPLVHPPAAGHDPDYPFQPYVQNESHQPPNRKFHRP